MFQDLRTLIPQQPVLDFSASSSGICGCMVTLVPDTGAVLSRSRCSSLPASRDIHIAADPPRDDTVCCSGGVGRRSTFCVNEKIGNVNFPWGWMHVLGQSALSGCFHTEKGGALWIDKGCGLLRSRGGAVKMKASSLPAWVTLIFGCRTQHCPNGCLKQPRQHLDIFSFSSELKQGKSLFGGKEQRITHRAFGAAHGIPYSISYALGHSSVKTTQNHEKWSPGRSGGNSAL